MSKRLRDALKGVGTYKDGKYVPKKKEEKKGKPLTGKLKKMGDTNKTVPTKTVKPKAKPAAKASPKPAAKPVSKASKPAAKAKPKPPSTAALKSTSGKIGGYLYGKASLGTKLNSRQRARRERDSSPEAMGAVQKTSTKAGTSSMAMGGKGGKFDKSKKKKYKGASRSRKR